MKRKTNWQELLQDEFFLARKREFTWGSNDCAIFCARCVERITGEPVLKAVQSRFTWNDKRQGLKLLAKTEFESMVSTILGPPVPANLCREGDVMLVTSAGVNLLGMHEGHFVISISEFGIARVPLENAVCGWSIP